VAISRRVDVSRARPACALLQRHGGNKKQTVQIELFKSISFWLACKKDVVSTQIFVIVVL
jgi:hypothetical protein